MALREWSWALRSRKHPRAGRLPRPSFWLLAGPTQPPSLQSGHGPQATWPGIAMGEARAWWLVFGSFSPEHPPPAEARAPHYQAAEWQEHHLQASGHTRTGLVSHAVCYSVLSQLYFRPTKMGGGGDGSFEATRLWVINGNAEAASGRGGLGY